MLAIVNVSDPSTPSTGINQYEVRINRKVIARFEHDRQYGAAAQCLRDAADAVEKCTAEEKALMLEHIMALIKETEDSK